MNVADRKSLLCRASRLTPLLSGTGPKAAQMKIDETTIGVNGMPQLPPHWYHLATFCILVTYIAFGDIYFGIDRICFEARDLHAKSRSTRMYKFVISNVIVTINKTDFVQPLFMFFREKYPTLIRILAQMDNKDTVTYLIFSNY